MTDLGELKVRISADATQLERDMKRATGVVQQGAGGMTSAFGRMKSELLSLAPAISAVGLVTFGKQAIDAAGHIVDLADRIGFASDTIAAMEIPLAASGASLDEFASSINRMNNAIGEARNGNEATIRAFDALGLSVDKLAKMSPEEQFYEIASALGQIKDQSTQTEAGMNIFGRSFSTMLPLLKEYGGDMRKAVEEQKKLNDELSPETLARIDAFGDSLSAAGIKIRNAFLEAFGAILKVLETIPQATDTLNNTASIAGDVSGEFPSTVAQSKFNLNRKPGGGVLGTEQYGPVYQPPKSAKGSNTELLARIQAQKDAATATKEHSKATDELTEKNKELASAMREAEQIQAMLHDRLSRSLTDVVFKAGSAKDAMLGFAEAIARAAFEKKVAGPLADAIIGTSTSKGLLDSVTGGLGDFFGGFFADGGSPPVGVPSVVGERGPEIFVPNTSGTIVPNHKLGGQTVNVYQNIQVNPGVPELINAKIRESAPVIAAMAQQGIRAGAEKGGTDSQLFRLRS